MVSKTILSASALFALAFAQNNNNGNNNAADSTTLSDDALQTGSFFDGGDGLGAEDGQALSTTSKNNFINFCAGKTLTNGLQITDGSCNGIVMGDIPAKNNMISAIITNPKNGDSLPEGEDFTITVQTQNLEAGAFTNADATYYAAPQQLNGQGQVIGHTHVTVQDLGNSLNPAQPPDATQFAFFKGINDAGNGQGLLSADVAGGLPAGNFRVCTLTSNSNHAPVVMPVAQRGSQDDCSKFTVVAANQNNGNNANAGQNGQQGANAGQNGQQGANAGQNGQQGANAGQNGQQGANAGQNGQQGANQNNGQNGQQGANQNAQNAGQNGQQGANQNGGQNGQQGNAQNAGQQSNNGNAQGQQQAQQNGNQQSGNGQANQNQGQAQQNQQQGNGGKNNKRSRLAKLSAREFIA